MSALHQQLQFELQRFQVNTQEIESIFIGGGTPSTVHPELFRPIFELLTPLIKEEAEITTEANPNSATLSWLQGMYDLGVNRVSFGVQSFNREKLKGLNRNHSPKDATEAINNAHKIGFKNISLDIIYNYQGDTTELLEKDLNQAFELPINHISAYELTIESQTKFYETPEVKQEDDNLAFFVKKTIEAKGFPQYEISNYGTYQSFHNRGYWELKDYMGVGAGAVGFQKDRRYYPHTNIDNYIKEPCEAREEILTQEDLLTEKILLGLRSNIGIKEGILDEKTKKNADFLVEHKKLNKRSSTYYNPNFFLSDEIALYLLD
jgi:oxygen-independent coproporphyrinogen-3 oxidase